MRRGLLAGGAVLLAGVLVILGINMVADRQEARVAANWSKLDPGPQDLEKRFPPRLANETALEVERRAAALGISLAPADLSGRPRPSDEDSAAFQSVSRAASDYVFRQVSTDDDVIAVPSGAYSDFLQKNDSELGRLEVFLVGSDPPVWESGAGSKGETLVPDLIGHLSLQRILLTRALDHARVGDEAASLRSLDASWLLETALVERPEEITFVIALAVAKLQAGVLRKTEAPASTWGPRLNGRSWWRRYVTVVHSSCRRFEGWMGALTLGRIIPIGRLWANDYSDLLSGVVSKLAREDPCGFTPERGKGIWERSLGRTNFLGRLSLTKLEESAHRLFRAEVELEGTQVILAAKEARRLSGEWPAELSGLESTVCPGSWWIYEVNPNGSATMAFAGAFEDWPRSSLLRLPLRFTVKRPPKTATRS